MGRGRPLSGFNICFLQEGSEASFRKSNSSGISLPFTAPNSHRLLLCPGGTRGVWSPWVLQQVLEDGWGESIHAVPAACRDRTARMGSVPTQLHVLCQNEGQKNTSNFWFL